MKKIELYQQYYNLVKNEVKILDKTPVNEFEQLYKVFKEQVYLLYASKCITFDCFQFLNDKLVECRIQNIKRGCIF